MLWTDVIPAKAQKVLMTMSAVRRRPDGGGRGDDDAPGHVPGPHDRAEQRQDEQRQAEAAHDAVLG